MPGLLDVQTAEYTLVEPTDFNLFLIPVAMEGTTTVCWCYKPCSMPWQCLSCVGDCLRDASHLPTGAGGQAAASNGLAGQGASRLSASRSRARGSFLCQRVGTIHGQSEG